MLLRRHVAEHGAAEPADHGGADARRAAKPARIALRSLRATALVSRMRCSAQLLRSGAPLIRDPVTFKRCEKPGSRVCGASLRFASCSAPGTRV
jgi:hypothetical protein